MVAHRRTLMASRLPNSTEVVETTKNNGKMELRIGTLNCHGLRTDERKLELLEELEKVNINILGLTETRSTGKGCDSINGQWLYYYSGHNSEVGGSGRENAGVGILLPKIMEKMVIGTHFYDERIMEMELEVGRRRISLVVAYAPHSGKTVEGYNQFIDKVTDLIQLVKMDGVRTKKLLLAGDWNGNVGFKQDDAEKLGQYGYGARNRNGQLLMDFAVEQNLWVLNTCFRKRMGRRWTWKLAGARNPTKVMIDMFLSEDLGWIRDVRAMVMGFSDHKLVMAKLEVMAMVGRNGTVNKKVGDRRKLKVVLANKRQDLNRIDDFGALVEEQKVIFNECAKSKEVSAKFGPSTIEWMRIRYEKRMLYNEGEIEKGEMKNIDKMTRKMIENDLRCWKLEVMDRAIRNGRLRAGRSEKSVVRSVGFRLHKEGGGSTSTSTEAIGTIVDHFQRMYEDVNGPILTDDPNTEIDQVTGEEVKEARLRRSKEVGMWEKMEPGQW